MREKMIAIPLSEEKSQNIIQVVQDYGKRLFSFIRGRVNTDEDAQDILQDVWYQFSNVAETEPIEQVSSWLFTVARNRITDKYRKQKMQSLEDFVYEDEDGEVNYKDILLMDKVTPEDEQLKHVFWEELFKALDELPEEQKQVFVWNELDDMTFREISEKTGENIKTLISRKRYAVAHLRARLQTLHNELLNY
ncbi:MAG TPA: sigma-70 family RNA polymerase sigma factor [Bacteroidia bacterium]|jgi:RNA polymerase sigma factor (sigma-70 family)|nr:sigma-70 family RNA polymerase sigma factor [Bacteroidia bacterium]